MSESSATTGIRGEGDPLFERVAILGLGLLGGSVAIAARQSGVARSFAGAGRRRDPLEYALGRGIVDEIGDVASATRGADLVVLATPVSSMQRVLKEI
jgi:prephenate dehydrogenase/3-phosphoshikimate 1-carboxyvinyltransferase